MQSLALAYSPSAVELMAFIGCLFFLAAGINQVMKLLDRNREKPPPAETYTTLKECSVRHEAMTIRMERTENEVQAMRAEIKAELNQMTRLDEERASGLHERINRVLEAVSELRGEMRRMNK